MKHNKNLFLAFALFLGALLILDGCKKEDNPADVEDEHPQEVITTVILELTDSANTTSKVTAFWSNKDGNVLIDTLRLSAGKTYNGKIEVYDSTKHSHDEQHLTHEIEEESDVHQFFYTPQGNIASVVTVEKTDKDANNLPVGLEYKVRVSAGATAGTVGTLRIVLSHYDEGPKTAEPSDESDIDIEIPVKIQ